MEHLVIHNASPNRIQPPNRSQRPASTKRRHINQQLNSHLIQKVMASTLPDHSGNGLESSPIVNDQRPHYHTEQGKKDYRRW